MTAQEMTPQEAYDGISEYFSRKGAALARVWNDFDQKYFCKYRTDDGSKCAIGCLVPDEKYDAEWDEGGGSCGSEVIDAVWGGLDSETYDFLRKAQELHDDADSVPTFLSSLDKLAESFGLTVAS